jgi:hypothetical protein
MAEVRSLIPVRSAIRTGASLSAHIHSRTHANILSNIPIPISSTAITLVSIHIRRLSAMTIAIRNSAWIADARHAAAISHGSAKRLGLDFYNYFLAY